MSKPIRLFKLVTGELVLGKFDEEANMLEDVAIIQVVPHPTGCSDDDASLRLSFFEQECRNSGNISGEHFMYEYKKLPRRSETKYLEACTNLTLSTGGSSAESRGQVSAHQVAFVPASGRKRPHPAPACSGTVGRSSLNPAACGTPPYERTPLPAAPAQSLYRYRGRFRPQGARVRSPALRPFAFPDLYVKWACPTST